MKPLKLRSTLKDLETKRKVPSTAEGLLIISEPVKPYAANYLLSKT